MVEFGVRADKNKISIYLKANLEREFLEKGGCHVYGRRGLGCVLQCWFFMNLGPRYLMVQEG